MVISFKHKRIPLIIATNLIFRRCAKQEVVRLRIHTMGRVTGNHSVPNRYHGTHHRGPFGFESTPWEASHEVVWSPIDSMGNVTTGHSASNQHHAKRPRRSFGFQSMPWDAVQGLTLKPIRLRQTTTGSLLLSMEKTFEPGVSPRAFKLRTFNPLGHRYTRMKDEQLWSVTIVC
jgi:hypothetical protein